MYDNGFVSDAYAAAGVDARQADRGVAALVAVLNGIDTGRESRAVPLSGHYATLLRGTAQTFLKDFDVYVTDWANARDVPLIEGRFDFHDYIDQVSDILRHIGANTKGFARERLRCSTDRQTADFLRRRHVAVQCRG